MQFNMMVDKELKKMASDVAKEQGLTLTGFTQALWLWSVQASPIERAAAVSAHKRLLKERERLMKEAMNSAMSDALVLASRDVIGGSGQVIKGAEFDAMSEEEKLAFLRVSDD